MLLQVIFLLGNAIIPKNCDEESQRPLIGVVEGEGGGVVGGMEGGGGGDGGG